MTRPLKRRTGSWWRLVHCILWTVAALAVERNRQFNCELYFEPDCEPNWLIGELKRCRSNFKMHSRDRRCTASSGLFFSRHSVWKQEENSTHVRWRVLLHGSATHSDSHFESLTDQFLCCVAHCTMCKRRYSFDIHLVSIGTRLVSIGNNEDNCF